MKKREVRLMIGLMVVFGAFTHASIANAGCCPAKALRFEANENSMTLFCTTGAWYDHATLAVGQGSSESGKARLSLAMLAYTKGLPLCMSNTYNGSNPILTVESQP